MREPRRSVAAATGRQRCTTQAWRRKSRRLLLFAVYMLMPPTRPRIDPKLAPHLAVMAGIALCTGVLLLWPQAVLAAGYQCRLHALFGVRCPFCGMTRDFAAMLHGQRPVENPCSRLALVVVYGVYPTAVVIAWWRKSLDVFYGKALCCGVAVALAAMLVLNNLG